MVLLIVEDVYEKWMMMVILKDVVCVLVCVYIFFVGSFCLVEGKFGVY